MAGNNAVAEYDQLLADAMEKFEVLGLTVAKLRDERGRGEMQAVADTVAMLMTWDPTELASVLTAAALVKSREGRA